VCGLSRVNAVPRLVLHDIRQLGGQVYGQSKQNITFLLLFYLFFWQGRRFIQDNRIQEF
jgi:hypothetical protein